MTTPIVSERQSPAFSFYAKDFIVGTVTLSLAERGAYITLLAYQWDNGSVPDDARERARVLGCTRREADVTWERIKDKFQPCGDAWRNTRLEVERSKQSERRASLAANGSKGGRPKNQKDKQTETNSFQSGLANKNQKESRGRDNLNESLSSSSSSSSSTPTLQRTVVSGTALARVPHPSERHGMQTLHRSGHQSHAFCSERICVPVFQHEKFVGALGGVDADGRLRAFYVDTVNGLHDSQPIESDPLKFWPPLVAARWPPHDLSVGTRTAALQRATAEFMRGGQ